MKKILLSFCMALLSAATVYAQKNCYVVKADGSTQKAETIKVKNAEGDIEVIVEKNIPPINFTRRQYRYAFIPKPKNVEQLEQLLMDKKYQEVIKYAPQLFNNVKFIGWGDFVASCECEAHIALKNPAEAKKSLAKAKSATGGNQSAVLKAEIQCLIADGQFQKVEAYLKQLMTSKDDNTAAFAFNMKAKVYYAQGQKKLAVNEYLKTLLLFEPKNKKTVNDRQLAKQEAVAIMRELKDPRAAKIEAME